MVDTPKPATSQVVKTFALLAIFSLFAISVCASVIAQANTPAVDPLNVPTASNQFAILVTTMAGFASMLAAQLFQFYRESRNRKWDLADRATARAEVRQHAETQRIENIQTAIELARLSNANRDHLGDAIAKNTEITSEAVEKANAAYVAANSFNEKIEALQRELIALRSGPDDGASAEVKS